MVSEGHPRAGSQAEGHNGIFWREHSIPTQPTSTCTHHYLAAVTHLPSCKVRARPSGVTPPQAREHSSTLVHSRSSFGYITPSPTPRKIILSQAGDVGFSKGDLEFAVLLKLGHQAEDLLGSFDALGAEVGGPVGGRVLQEVAVIDHEATRARDALEADVGHPVDAPHHGPVLQVEVGHGVQGVAPVLLPVQVPGAEPHQGCLERPDQLLRLDPVAAAENGLEGLIHGTARDLGDFFTLGICQQFIPPVILCF